MKLRLYIVFVLAGVLTGFLAAGQEKRAFSLEQPSSAPQDESQADPAAGEPDQDTEATAGSAAEEASGAFPYGLIILLLVLVTGACFDAKAAGSEQEKETDSEPAADPAPSLQEEDASSEGEVGAVEQQEALTEGEVSAVEQPDAPDDPVAEVDHSFILEVALGTERLEFRMEQFDDTDVRKKALLRIARNFDRKLQDLGYERGKLVGALYRDGMTCYSEFTTSDDPAHREPTITRVFLPQVFYQGKLIQVPKIEVSKYYDSTTHEERDD